jgi:hypothetical protein
MRNLFLLFILFIFSPTNAQKYIFNTLTKYSISYNNIKNEGLSYSNSNDDTYFLRIRKYESSLTANLYDYKNLKHHIFTVKESKVNGEIVFNFEYENTSNIYYFNKNEYSKYVFAFETFELNDTIKRVNLKIYKNSKKKKPLMNYDLQLKNHEKNLFPVFRINCIHPYEFLENLNIFKNGVVINAQGNTLSGRLIEYKLEDLKEVNFEINIPKIPE